MKLRCTPAESRQPEHGMEDLKNASSNNTLQKFARGSGYAARGSVRSRRGQRRPEAEGKWLAELLANEWAVGLGPVSRGGALENAGEE